MGRNTLIGSILTASAGVSILLLAGFTSQEPRPVYTPGLGEIMTQVQMRHAKLWLAGQNSNWPLAAYEIDELEEAFADAMEFHPTHKSSPVALTELIPGMTDPPLQALRSAVAGRDGAAFTQAFDALTAACNACHQTTEFGYNVVTRPSGNPFTNQNFAPPGATGTKTWSFDDLPVAQLPAGWRVEATHPRGPLATWGVSLDRSAPSPDKVLGLKIPEPVFGGTFNLCWTDAVRFLDGEIEVRFKALKGREDQGGGVIWRAQDRNNYYIARFNPLEDNFRIYSVRNGSRRTLESARVSLPAGQWHTLKIVQRGDRFEGYLNGKKLLEGKSTRFPEAGGVGLWTKADATTLFDDFSVHSFTPANQRPAQ